MFLDNYSNESASKNLRKNKEKIIGYSLLILLLFFFFKDIIKDKLINQKIEKEGLEGVCKVYKFISHKRYQNYYYYYYVNGKKNENFEDIDNPNLSEASINKFYSIKYLNDSPEKAKLYLNNEVTDTSSILLNGFIKKKISISKFDYSKNSYYEIEVDSIY